MNDSKPIDDDMVEHVCLSCDDRQLVPHECCGEEPAKFVPLDRVESAVKSIEGYIEKRINELEDIRDSISNSELRESDEASESFYTAVERRNELEDMREKLAELFPNVGDEPENGRGSKNE